MDWFGQIGARNPSNEIGERTTMAYRFSCSSSLDFTEEFVKRHFHGSNRKAPSEFCSNLEHSWSLCQQGKPPGANVDRHLGVPSLLLRNFRIVWFVRFFVRLLWSGSKFLLIKCSRSLTPSLDAAAGSRMLFNFKNQSFRLLESRDEIP